MKHRRRVCVVTGARSEYGLLYWIIKEIKESPSLELDLVVTGMHLAPEFGLTYQAIEDDGFNINRKVEMLLSSDSPLGTIKSVSLGMSGFGDAYVELNPDIVFLLGDRFELFAAASAALFLGIPICHMHGGEVTVGAVDDAIRHSITKMSHLHLTATEQCRQRVIQLGERPESVFNVGAPGLENIARLDLLSKSEVEERIGKELGERSLLVAWHPPTLSKGEEEQQLRVLLEALRSSKANLIFSSANADAGGRSINLAIEEFVSRNSKRASYHESFGRNLYLSILHHVSGIIGNSSSGIIEAPSIPLPAINIGDRQVGRERATSVIDCSADLTEIDAALRKIFDPEFQRIVKNTKNPYGGGYVATRVASLLESADLSGVKKKRFYDLDMAMV